MKARGVAILATVWVLALTQAHGQSNVALPTTWVPNGSVNAITTINGTTYIGGNFDCVGPYTGSLAALDATSGAALAFPTFQGQVDNSFAADHPVAAIVSDGSGGWFVGGEFTQAGNAARQALAHVLANGAIDPNWNPGANSAVFSLSLQGSALFVGGSFTSIGGQPRNRVAALDAGTGAVLPWNPGADNIVTAVAANGNLVYLGGQFQTAGANNAPLPYAAAVDSTTGIALTAWAPSPDNEVDAFAFAGSTVYLGGQFNGTNSPTGLGGGPYIAAVDSTTGLASNWNP